MKYIKLLYYFFTPRNNYLRFGLIFLLTFSILAIYLNFQGMSCLKQLAPYYSSNIGDAKIESIESLEMNCFIVTNSYVYSIFGIIIGVILILVYFFKIKKRK